MRAGELRDRVTIQASTRTSDGQGGKTQSTTTIAANVPAQVLPVSGREVVLSAALTSVVTTLVRLRYRSDVSVLHRIVFGTRTLQVQYLQDPDGRRRELQLFCAEVPA